MKAPSKVFELRDALQDAKVLLTKLTGEYNNAWLKYKQGDDSDDTYDRMMEAAEDIESLGSDIESIGEEIREWAYSVLPGSRY